MSRIIEQPPENGVRSDGLYAGGWWHTLEGDERIVCDLCPRECHLKPGDRGFCFVRQNVDGEMMLTTYGRSTGFCIDPIEKKPLNHFLPGTSVLSFGTAGCNLGCKFCQNWDISKSREVERLSELASPAAVAAAARHFDCRSVAYTYNDPIIWAEYAIDTARACRVEGIKNVAVTAGYISSAARAPFFEFMDAANVDLKSFSEEFYYKVTYSHLQPVLETLEWLKKETDVWFEITNLLIPDTNDSPDELREMCNWILNHVGDEVPVHFSAFHSDFRMKDRPNTPPETLVAAREIAHQQGLKFCYVGNVNDVVNQSTYCPDCRGLLIQRNWYELGEYRLDHNHCGHCGMKIAGWFEESPGHWGRKRQPVQISQFSQPLPITSIPVRQKEDSAMTTASKTDGAAARLEAQRPKLSDEQQQLIHKGACEVIASSILKRPLSVPDPTLGGAADRTVMGAFVTLKRNGNLRACCGALGRPMPLGTALQQAAVRTATEDTRLPAISPTELPFLDVDVSLLHGFQPISEKGEDRAASVEVGRHGLQIQRGNNAGLLLPSVAREQDYDAVEFLRQLCRKAGLPATAWMDDDTEIQVFETLSIAGVFEATGIEEGTAVAPLLNNTEIRALAAHCGNNIASIVQGATPSYYALGCSDGTVNGIALTLKPVGSDDTVHFSRFSMRPGMPLQSTAFDLGKSIAESLSSGQLKLPSADLHVSVSILHDSAMHGSAAKPDLRGSDPKTRALMIVEGAKTAWMYDPEKTSDELLADLTEKIAVFNAEATGIFSFAVQTNEPTMTVVNAPKPSVGPDQRPAAVAGKFYPADATELSEMLDGFLADKKGRKSKCTAIMVPHAGLMYSGSVAGAVFAKTKIPDSVIVIGPKHTRNGVEWAVAPNNSWAIPGGEVAADPQLAAQLVEAIPGLKMDAAAHQGEHAIEVELPFLAKLNPNTRVVGIAIGGGSLAQCHEFAEGLAKVLKGRDEETLLVISSDMNHYASDEDNRRLDEIAIKSLQTLDPDELYETVTGHGISMCGVLPAVIAMEASKQLGGLKSAKRLAYSTSADVSGDKSRVVGYCGMQFS
ncbi:MAG: AmmeMemoRadiSam system radical SAM enzyme [Pirellulaceae bacterium]|nr:AmmeMemoRadiSam system radical SAM enzyme [Pirellulaceae bacterium]